MILTSGKPVEDPKDIFSFPPPTYSAAIGGAASMHPIVTNVSGIDGISSGVLMKRLFVSDVGFRFFKTIIKCVVVVKYF